MKIAFFTDTFIPEVNGVTNTLKRFIEYLDKTEHEYRFYAPQYNKSDKKDMAKRFPSVQFPLYNEVRISLPFYSEVRAELDEFQPDIIHVVTPLGIGHTGVKYAKQRRVPLVSSFHTNFDSYLKYYSLAKIEPFLWAFFRRFHRPMLVNFVPSKDTMKVLNKNGINNVKIWSRGIDISKFSPSKRNIELLEEKAGTKVNDDTVKVLYTGRVAVEKDLDILMDSIKVLNKEVEKEVKYFVVGDGPLLADIKRKAPDNVFFTGYMRGEELFEIYASCDIFAFPSTTETFGNVVLEAMASGLCPLVVKSGGVVENVIHEHDGLIAEPRDVRSFADGLKEMIENESLRTKLQTNALESVKSKTWDKIYDQLIMDYEIAITTTEKLKQAR